MKKLFIALTLAFTALFAGVSMAAVDVTAVTTEISGASAPVAAIGAAVLLVLVGIKVFKWVRRAM